MNAGQIIGWGAALLTAAGGVGWLASLITIRASRRKILADAGKTDADAAQTIQKSALELVAEFEADAKEARAEVKAMRVDMRKLEAQLGEALAEGRAAIQEYRRLKTAILDPQATVGGLRDLVTGSPRNGTFG